MSKTALKAESLSKIYKMGSQEIYALNNVELTINEGDMVAVVGTSGSGKSTLLHILGGLDKPTSGCVFIGEKRLDTMNDSALSALRREEIGFVFQKFCLVEELSVLENICLPILLCNRQPDYEYINEICDILGLSDRKNHLPSQLSGGQQQRTAIARAISNNPQIILCDEPTGNLDRSNSNQVIEHLCKINSLYKKTILIVTHDKEIARHCKRTVEISDGCVC
ncbi:MAG: ABC transporter ATP-binding protein [Lachnospiraceae bacterium]